MPPSGFENNDLSGNPYQSASLTYESESQSAFETDEQARALRSLGNWQICFAVVGFLGTGLILLFGLIQAVFMLRGGGAGGVFLGGVMLAMGFFCYLLPSILVFQAALSARAVANLGPSKMTPFVNAQRAFWRYCGILMLVVFIVYFGFFVVLMLFGLSGIS
jgi:hypothetical protein